MHRRSLLLGASGAVVSSLAEAASRCLSMTQMGPLCRVFIKTPQVIRQKCPQWCWAASAAMIFAMHGYRVDQLKIVWRVFGQLVCLPSPNIVMAQVLSVPWQDDDGRPFQVNLNAAYDFAAGVNAINDAFIVDQLRNNKPLLYGNVHHAMVLSQVDFIDTPNGPLIQAAGVFDPFPGNPEGSYWVPGW